MDHRNNFRLPGPILLWIVGLIFLMILFTRQAEFTNKSNSQPLFYAEETSVFRNGKSDMHTTYFPVNHNGFESPIVKYSNETMINESVTVSIAPDGDALPSSTNSETFSAVHFISSITNKTEKGSEGSGNYTVFGKLEDRSSEVSENHTIFGKFEDSSSDVPASSSFLSPLSETPNVTRLAPNKGFDSASEKSNATETMRRIPKVKRMVNMKIPEMNDLLQLRQFRSKPLKPRWPSPVDKELKQAKMEILHSPSLTNNKNLYAPLYKNLSMLIKSYELMEKILKVYIYMEGEKPIMHQPLLQGIYASEGWFMKQLYSSNVFVTKDPKKAHLFYLPFGSRNLEHKLYVPGSHTANNLIEYLKNYLDIISGKYTFWNRTYGADHFLVACHDWAPKETRKHMSRCIRALCNADVNNGFAFGKDVSLPQTYVRWPQTPLRGRGGKPASERSTLAFFAGNMHGYLRPLLLQQWGGGKDPDMKIFGRLGKGMGYIQHMRSSKYCICARGYEGNSPRIVEAIFFECVPVILSDNYVPPFFTILNWESFAVFVMEKDIPNLKNILLGIPKKKYLKLQMGVKKVQQHFLWHPRPVKYDLFHMILHSIWLNRVLRA